MTGQDMSVIAVSKALKRALTNEQNRNRPRASFIFAGPIGIGKTKLIKLLTTYYFASETSMLKLDMSRSYTIPDLIGFPPYSSEHNKEAMLTDPVKRRPDTVVVFDKIERANQQVLKLVLQILENGRLTDSRGVTINFTRTFIILTSNVGSEIERMPLLERCATGEEICEKYMCIHRLVIKKLRKIFSAKLLEHLNEIVVFYNGQLMKQELEKLISPILKKVLDRIYAKHNIMLDVSAKLQTYLIETGYEPADGIQSLRKSVKQLLQKKVSEDRRSGKIKPGDIACAHLNTNNTIEILIADSTCMNYW
jgi:ATP-dependent Clp protease ATP-binding subunit ClpC